MLKKLLQSAGIGLVLALVILFVLPRLNLNQHNEPMSFKNAVRNASPAVVNVYSQSFSLQNNANQGLQISNLGSGVIMSKEGYILTNRHVINNADQIVVALQSGQIFNANVIGSDSLTDLAVLKIKANNLPTIHYNPDRQVYVGDVVLAIGNPYNLGQSVSQGIISATGRNAVGDAIGRQNFIQTDASINRGNSGGALINSLGELVGISTLSIGKDSNEIAEGLSFAIPTDIAIDVMNKIIRDGRVIRGYIGIESDLYTLGQRSNNAGVLVTNVATNGPAYKAGIRQGDIILKFNNEPVTSPTHLMRLVSDIPPNTQVKVLVARLAQQLEFNVTLAEYPH